MSTLYFKSQHSIITFFKCTMNVSRHMKSRNALRLFFANMYYCLFKNFLKDMKLENKCRADVVPVSGSVFFAKPFNCIFSSMHFFLIIQPLRYIYFTILIHQDIIYLVNGRKYFVDCDSKRWKIEFYAEIFYDIRLLWLLSK